MNDDQVYLFQLRMFLERLSWFARSHDEVATYTLAHIQNFKKEKLREYEAKLRGMSTQIAWKHLDPAGGSIGHPTTMEQLQLADLAVSAIAPAFNPDEFGNTEDRYIRELSKQFYRHGSGAQLSSYGLKIHPWDPRTSMQYAWVKDL